MSPETISKIKELNIIDIAQQLGIKVSKKKALCINHDDKNPSLNFDEKKGKFKCFACDFKGDNITLVMKYYNYSFIEACTFLIQQYNLIVDELPKRVISKKTIQANFTKQLYNEKRNANPEIYEWLINELNLSDVGSKYLTSRGFSHKSIESLKIKDMPSSTIIFNALKSKFGEEALINCGLCKIDNGKIKNIWWDHVVIFPFFDIYNKIKYLQGRRLNLGKIDIKYVNLNKLKPLVYNLQILNNMNEGDSLYICEGVPDTISAINLNLNAIGILGATNFDATIVNVIKKFRIYLIQDSDLAGHSFTRIVIDEFKKIGRTIEKLTIPKPYKDLNEYFISKNS